MADDRATYPPLDTPKPVCPGVWIVDGPTIRFGPPGLRLPFPTRMTVLRLGRNLFLHSPTRLTAGLRAEIAALGEPRWIVGPNRLHYWWLPDWHAAWPEADVFVAPRTAEQARDRIDFPVRVIDGADRLPWDDGIATLPIGGRYLTEIAFFHRASRSLLLADLIENFELSRIASPLQRGLARLGGVAAPHGQMPRDLRLTFLGHRRALQAAVRTLLEWRPERVIFAHGRWFECDGTARLRHAFRWLLG